MAGDLKPDSVGKEGEISFGDYYTGDATLGSPGNLIDGVISNLNVDSQSGVILDTYRNGWIVFTLFKKSNIWSIGLQYTDGGGTTNRPINLYKLSDSGAYEKLGVYPTNPQFNVWYKLFGDLEPGTYKITPTGRYSSFNEWYIERADNDNYLYLKDNTVYGIKAVG